jgi:lipid-A-disaccharide synthase
MPNILLGRAAVPEVVPDSVRERVSPVRLAEEVAGLLLDADRRERMAEDLRQVRARLGQPGASARTAELIAELVQTRGAQAKV